MNKRPAVRACVSEWCLEFSVLLTVFPLLDQALDGRYNIWVLGVSTALAVLSFLYGVMLAARKGD